MLGILRYGLRVCGGGRRRRVAEKKMGERVELFRQQKSTIYVLQVVEKQ